MAVTVAIIGLGLIGGSLGLALASSPEVRQIRGYDCDPETVRLALEMGAIDTAGSLPEVAAEADWVFICTPLNQMAAVLGAIAPVLKPGCVVTDVGSTKEQVMRCYADLPPGVYGIGGHPMAGSEKRGITAADRYLFENAVYVLTPAAETPPATVAATVDLIKQTGARVKLMSPAEHDRVVSLISHLPHVLAVALVNLVAGQEEAQALAAGGFRDITRIASGSPELWEDILLSNREHISQGLQSLIGELEQLRTALADNQPAAVRSCLESACALRETFPARRRGLIPEFQEVLAIVPDRPGIIGQIGNWLGGHQINIVDIEILRVREGDGGTIRLGVPSREDAVRAVEVLQGEGIKAWTR